MKNTHLGLFKLSKLVLGSCSCFQSFESSILDCKKKKQITPPRPLPPPPFEHHLSGFWGQQSQKEEQSEIKTTEWQNMLVPGYPGSEYLLNTLVCFDDLCWHWDGAAFSVTKLQLNHWVSIWNMLWYFFTYFLPDKHTMREHDITICISNATSRPGLEIKKKNPSSMKINSIFL